MIGNLPSATQSGPTNVKTFFDTYYNTPVSFPAAEIDATIAFFVKRGFDYAGASSTAIILLNQSRVENVCVFSLLDKLKSSTDVQLAKWLHRY